MLEVGMGGFWVFFIFVLFCSQAEVLNSQNLSCNSKDLNALEGFLKGLDSEVGRWGNASSDDCCSWDGVSCELSSGSGGGRVVELSLGNGGLKGVVLKELAGLDQLKVLNLSRNSLEGALPSELFSLQRLEVLDLSYNGFSGSIPVDADLPSIRVFNISGNSFTGKQPLLVRSTNLTHFIISYNLLSGYVDTSICSNSSRIQVLQLSMNTFDGNVPAGFGNCSYLNVLSLDSNYLIGALPEDLFRLSRLTQLFLQENRLSSPLSQGIGNLSKLVYLDLSNNGIRGTIPDVFSNLRNLQHLAASSNTFNGGLPPSLLNLPELQILNLRNNSLEGEINLNCTAMTNLSSLDLGSNRFSGSILENLSSCRTLKSINLARNSLNGEIPYSFINLQDLSYLSLSNSSLHNISAALRILEQFKNLTTLVLTLNFRGEEMPAEGVLGFQSLKVFVVPNCLLLGSIPAWLQRCSKLQVLDLSWNRLGGSIPPWFSSLDSLFYLDLSNNSLTGEIPRSLTQLKGLISHSFLQEDSSSNFPFFFKRNQSTSPLQYNQFTSFPPTLDLSNNYLTGPILPEFENLKDLHVLDLSRNNLSGTIPSELSGMASLEVLDLSYNDLSGQIPASLTNLSFLSSFSVAHNHLSGPIPVEGQFSTFPNSSFEGNIDLCGDHFASCSVQKTSQPRKITRKNRRTVIGIAVGIGLGTASLLSLVLLFLLRTNVQRQHNAEIEVEDAEKHIEFSGSRLVLLFQNKEQKEITIDDLLKSTNNFDQANIIGCGGFGLVYKASLPDGRKVAIKRLTGDCGQMEREFQAEVEALSRAQHENLVLLQGYCRYGNDRLLIYSYMENGSLDYWLHEKLNGGYSLDWDTRLQIAQGAARGLAYLHQSCQPHILHRDIKSSNILLDENFEAHLADFGLARLILPYDTHVTTDLVGTLGYIPPEYGQASVATFKGDVYSFGVVLLELLTGKRPVEVCKPKGCRDLIAWVLQMKKEKRENEVFDPFLCDKQCNKQMLQVLDIACLCLSACPKVRPFIQQIVSWLDHVGHDGQVQPT
ncbi:phytosulfokine receptor 1 [Cinnamomum micranthum f. kanehirae]|uniref:non-specific serine/threonine protein kinase n=1 Tax=Cinnamomum micranthum f. kanehirae TaxID=337451 RepID=A0A3S3N5R7_9MAGN|nr:phytosulfokine receptor 1 [Cinnamomum micranthum f. kanehirae]